MGGLSLADIARWDPVAIGEVAQTAQKLAVAVDEAAQPLANMPVFETWTGAAASSAKWAMKDSVARAERYVGATKIVGGAASVAQDVVEGLVRANIDIHMQASAHGFRINEAANTVEIAISTAHWSDEDFAQLKADQRELQARVDKLITEANHADDELAKALNSVADADKKSVWAVDGKDVNSLVVGYLKGAQVDLLGDFGKAALNGTDSRLLPWLNDIGKLKVTRLGIAGSVAMMIPAIISDVGAGEEPWKAVVKEAGGTAVGVGAAAGIGAVLGTSVFPGIGTAGGVLIGAGVGGLLSIGASKGIGALLQ
ncbi:MAG: hypothetical protein PGN29_08780 [Gordonia paraffinivorans]